MRLNRVQRTGIICQWYVDYANKLNSFDFNVTYCWIRWTGKTIPMTLIG